MDTVKRYLLFVGEDYYPHGGWDDFARDYATVGAAKRGLPQVDLGVYAETNWAHIVDSETGEIVAVWDDRLGWFRSIDERTEAAAAAFVKVMEERRASGKPPPFVASVGAALTSVPTSAPVDFGTPLPGDNTVLGL